MSGPETARSLRRIFSVSIVVIGFLAVISAGTLIATSTALHRTTTEVAAAVESVHLVEEAEIGLLLHTRVRDPVLKRELEGELRKALGSAQQFVTSASEREILERAQASLAEYFSASARDVGHIADEAAAFAALEELVDANLANTRAARQDAIDWDRIAITVGIVLGVSIVVIAIVLILWLRRRVIHPLFALADTVRRFGEGQRNVRAAQGGPREIEQMSRRFNEMADSIATQRQAQVAFLGGIAHDLRTPLNALGLAVDLLGPGDELPPEPQLRRTLAVIARQIHHLDRMVGDFLDMSTIEGGKLELQVAEHDVRAIVRDAVGLFSESEGMRERFDVSMPSEPCIALCDDVRIGQAITNLVSNAIKYSPSDAPIEVRVVANATDVIVEVTDRGSGIPIEDQRRIFEPFRRVGATQAAKGAGLGLFNVKRVVEAHDGHVEVESEPRRGSTFRMYLPAARTLAIGAGSERPDLVVASR